MNESFVVSLDIGTSMVRVVVAETSLDGSNHIVGVGTASSDGIKKGAIVNIDQVVHSIQQAITEAERMVGIEIHGVYVGLSGQHISLQDSHGVVAVADEDKEISCKDIERVLQAARVMAMPPDREIIEIVPKQFIVDGFDGIKDPRGMIGVRLEVESLIVTGAKTIVHNITRSINKAGLNLLGMVFIPIAVADFCLSDDEKNLGVVLVDIGGGTTTLTFFHHNELVKSLVIPIGGSYITNDISIGLITETSYAEELKCKYGVAGVEFASKKDSFNIKSIGESINKTITQQDLANIIEPRLDEVFNLIIKEMKDFNLPLNPAGGFVFTGGVMNTPHILDFAKRKLGNSVRIASPKNLAAKDPSYVSGVSLIKYIHKKNLLRYYDPRESAMATGPKKNRKITAFDRVKHWFGEII